MNGEAILTVGAAVVALTQMAKWAMQGKGDAWGPLIVFALSALGVGLWGFSQDTFVRTDTWAYFAGWIAVALSASGVYGFTRAAVTAVTNLNPPPAGGGGSEPTRKTP